MSTPPRSLTLRQTDVPNLRDIRSALGAGGKPSLLGAKGKRIPLPRPLYAILSRIVSELATGQTVSVIPVRQELTTQKAAALLGVSRQFLVRLLDEGKIPFHRSGTHRRIYSHDLLAFKQQRDANRKPVARSGRHESFWKQFPGLVWSNSKASDTVMIRAVLTRPKKERLEAVGREFGVKRLQREWSILRNDKITPLSPRHVSLVSDLLDQTEKNLKHAPRISSSGLENTLVQA
jgi:excisionase family DNA binding protein